MTKKLYLIGGIKERDWEKIFSCIRFAALFVDNKQKNEDIKILKKIKIKDLDLDKNLKKNIEKLLCR